MPRPETFKEMTKDMEPGDVLLQGWREFEVTGVDRGPHKHDTVTVQVVTTGQNGEPLSTYIAAGPHSLQDVKAGA